MYNSSKEVTDLHIILKRILSFLLIFFMLFCGAFNENVQECFIHNNTAPPSVPAVNIINDILSDVSDNNIERFDIQRVIHAQLTTGKSPRKTSFRSFFQYQYSDLYLPDTVFSCTFCAVPSFDLPSSTLLIRYIHNIDGKKKIFL